MRSGAAERASACPPVTTMRIEIMIPPLFTALAAFIIDGAFVCAHGSMTQPLPRSAIDADEYPHLFCPLPVTTSADTSNWTEASNWTKRLGQACRWFSNGCSIGCPSCDGSTRSPFPAFECVPGAVNNDSCQIYPISGEKAPICDAPIEATVCDPELRTVNVGAACGADDDFFYYSPWRRPGSAPIIDACGSAGGRHPWQSAGTYGTYFDNTSHIKLGDLGSQLPPLPSGVVWRSGSHVEVAWAAFANHGGGYSYRLCPLSSELTEECFQRMPLAFHGALSWFRWHGSRADMKAFRRTAVSIGTTPAGSMWAKNPLPHAYKESDGVRWARHSEHRRTGEGFQPLCENSVHRPCSGEWTVHSPEIVDLLELPASLPPGRYVLGWRWDAEESNQVMASCSDIEVVAPPAWASPLGQDARIDGKGARPTPERRPLLAVFTAVLAVVALAACVSLLRTRSRGHAGGRVRLGMDPTEDAVVLTSAPEPQMDCFSDTSSDSAIPPDAPHLRP